jgi:uncharacterized protein YbjT (DUF2867 family)
LSRALGKKRKRILILGGTGLIGPHIVREVQVRVLAAWHKRQPVTT